MVSKELKGVRVRKGKCVTVKKGEIVGLDVKGIVKTLPYFSFQTCMTFFFDIKRYIIKIPYKVFFPYNESS